MENSKQCILFSTQQDQQFSVAALDLLTGTNLSEYKEGSVVAARSLDVISSEYLICSEKDRPKVNIWHLNKRNPFHKKIIVPGVVNALSISPCSTFLLCGIGTKIYIWQLATGNLVQILERHYQNISILRCGNDGTCFISGAEDGQCLLWSLADVFRDYSTHVLHGLSEGRNEPRFVWSDHQAKVTDAYVGRYGTYGKCITCSLDRTCKVYDIFEGTLMLSIVFDTPIWSLAVDLIEINLYAGGEDGKIYETKLCKESAENITRMASKETIFSGHTDKVTCLTVSIDGNCLVSGSNDCTMKKWHVSSKNCMVTYTYKAPVTNCVVMNTPTGLVHSRSVPDHFDLLKREMITSTDSFDDGSITIRLAQNEREQLNNIQLNGGTVCDFTEDTVNEPEKLKKELEHLQKVNQQLYNYSLDKIFNM